ncbi:hypothetical protein Hanom_Chr14g01291891 [Helianthus anomalus]
MFLLLVAMVVLTTQCSARSLVDTNDDVAVREEDLLNFYDNLMKYLRPTAISGEEVPVLDSSISPANAPEPTPVPEPSHKHKHHHHKHEHEEHHHKHDHEENEHHHHKHEHKDHHHKHEPKALPPTTPTSAPTQSPESFSFMTWMW